MMTLYCNIIIPYPMELLGMWSVFHIIKNLRDKFPDLVHCTCRLFKTFPLAIIIIIELFNILFLS